MNKPATLLIGSHFNSDKMLNKLTHLVK